MKIFVSYTYADKWQVKQIAEILENGGHDLWYDHRVIVGHDWKQAQLKAIMNCDSFLWLLSPESVQSEWCLWEFAEAVKASKPIIPVLIQRNTPIPPILQQRQYADFTEGATPANVARLMAGVHNALYIPIEDVHEIRAVPRGIPHSIQEPTKDDNDLVFISYTRKDVDFAVQVRERLEAAGHRTWMDIHDIPAGAIWPEEIDKALNRSTVVVGIMSPASVQSQNVKNEWSWALVYKVRLVLLYLEECRIPHRFIDLNFIDFRHDPEKKIEQLLQELSKSFNTTYTSPDTRKPLSAPTPVNINEPTERTSNPTTATSEIPVQAPSRDEIIDESEVRNRSRMLEKVYNFWIKGVLDNSLHGAALIDLGMSEKRDAVNHPWNTLFRHDDYAEDIQIGTGIASLFDRMSGELLILGQPGSGKTTMLLELGRRLIEYAQEDVSQPIPVVFNLSSWADERKPIADWLVDELNAKYQVPRKVGETWVNNDKLLLLLDGLDEVNIDYRNDCVVAINGYRSEHGLTKMAICSRIADYDALTERLKLQGAVLIQPLSTEQIDKYLASFGDTLAGVREAVNLDAELRELAEIPLMLSIMALAYREKKSDSLVVAESKEAKRNALFAAYVERMFDRRQSSELYPKSDVMHYLSFLAYQLNSTSQILFLIERIQPSWLTNSTSRRIYNILLRAIPTTIGFILILAINATVGGLVIGITVGLIVACIGTWIAYQSFKSDDNQIEKGRITTIVGAVTNVKEIDYEMKTAIISGLIGGPTGGLLSGLINASSNPDIQDLSIDILAAGMIAGFSAGIFAVLLNYALGISPVVEETEIKPVETLTWSLKSARHQVARIIVPLLIVTGIIGFLAALVGQVAFGIIAIVVGVTFISSVVGIIGGLRGTEIEAKNTSNQGIKQSFRYGLIGTLIGIIFAIIVGGPGAYILGWQTTLTISLFVGLISGLGYGFVYGGSAVLKHIIIRVLLKRNNNIPLNYSHFLDYAVALVLLRKVGGGYIFIHRTLLEYFASLYQSDNSSNSTT